jgi:hypothetical protein
VLTGAQAVVERRHNDGKERQHLELSVRAEEGETELESEGERCRVLWGWSSPYIGGRGSAGEVAMSRNG